MMPVITHIKMKTGKCQDLKREIGRILNFRGVKEVPDLVGAFGYVTTGIHNWNDTLEIKANLMLMKKTALFGTACLNSY